MHGLKNKNQFVKIFPGYRGTTILKNRIFRRWHSNISEPTGNVGVFYVRLAGTEKSTTKTVQVQQQKTVGTSFIKKTLARGQLMELN